MKLLCIKFSLISPSFNLNSSIHLSIQLILYILLIWVAIRSDEFECLVLFEINLWKVAFHYSNRLASVTFFNEYIYKWWAPWLLAKEERWHAWRSEICNSWIRRSIINFWCSLIRMIWFDKTKRHLYILIYKRARSLCMYECVLV